MEFTESAKHDLGAEFQRAGTARMEPFRATGFDLNAVNRRTGCFNCCQCISLGIEDADGCCIARPETARTFNASGAATDAASHTTLLLRLVAFINARHFKQCRITTTAICIALCSRKQTRQK